MGFLVIFVLSAVFLLLPVGGGGSTETLYQEITLVDRFNVTEVKRFPDQSLSDCALRCVSDELCVGFMMHRNGSGNCFTLHGGTQSLTTDEQSVVFKDCRVFWCGPPDWPPRDQPVLYRSFDVIGSLLLLNNGSQLVPGVMGQGVAVNLDQRQWIEINGAAASCLSNVETCGPEGATLAVWIKINECPHLSGIISSWRQRPLKTKGVGLLCRNNNLRWRLDTLNGVFKADLPRQPGWIHYTFVLGVHDEIDGFTVYVNGVLATEGSMSSDEEFAPGSGAMVIGRRYLDFDSRYVSVVVDELLLWNRKLTQPEIQQIFNMN